MMRHSKLRTQLAVASVGMSILLVAQASEAASIGQTHIHSLQNEPLLASIDISNIDPKDFSVSIASNSIYQQMGLDSDTPINVKFVKKTTNSGSLLLTSSTPISEPFADVVLIVNDKGRAKSVPKTLLLSLDKQNRPIKSFSEITSPLLSVTKFKTDKNETPLLTQQVQVRSPLYASNRNDSADNFKPLSVIKNYTPPPLFDNPAQRFANMPLLTMQTTAAKSQADSKSKIVDIKTVVKSKISKEKIAELAMASSRSNTQSPSNQAVEHPSSAGVLLAAARNLSAADNNPDQVIVNVANASAANEANPLHTQATAEGYQPLKVLASAPPPLFYSPIRLPNSAPLFANNTVPFPESVPATIEPTPEHVNFMLLAAQNSLPTELQDQLSIASTVARRTQTQDGFKPLQILVNTAPLPLFDSPAAAQADDALLFALAHSDIATPTANIPNTSASLNPVSFDMNDADSVVIKASNTVSDTSANEDEFKPLQIRANAMPPPLFDSPVQDFANDSSETLLASSQTPVENTPSRIETTEVPSIKRESPDSLDAILRAVSQPQAVAENEDQVVIAANKNAPRIEQPTMTPLTVESTRNISKVDTSKTIQTSDLDAVTIQVTRHIKNMKGQLLASKLLNDSQMDENTVLIRAAKAKTV